MVLQRTVQKPQQAVQARGGHGGRAVGGRAVGGGASPWERASSLTKAVRSDSAASREVGGGAAFLYAGVAVVQKMLNV